MDNFASGSSEGDCTDQAGNKRIFTITKCSSSETLFFYIRNSLKSYHAGECNVSDIGGLSDVHTEPLLSYLFETTFLELYGLEKFRAYLFEEFGMKFQLSEPETIVLKVFAKRD